MYFSVSKFYFSEEDVTAYDEREMKSLCASIRSRFKVLASPVGKGELCIAVVYLARNEAQLSQTLDGIAKFCEDSGFGRVEDEATLMDDVSVVDEIDDIEDAEESH